MKTLLFGATLLSILGTSACNSHQDSLATPTPPVPDVMLQSGRSLEKVKTNDVQYRLYQILSASPKNINFSPLSLDMAFALVYEGANGKTREFFQQVFGFPNEGEFSFASELKQKVTPPTEIFFGNSVWVKTPKLVLDDYKKVVQDDLNAPVAPLDLKKINDWVTNTTQGKVKNLLTSLDSKTEAVFLNAIYLKAAWATAFKVEATHREHFAASPSLNVTVPFMHAREDFLYAQDEISQWVELPYRDSDLVMDIGLPLKKNQLRAVENKMTTEYMNGIYSKLKLEKVELALPKFKFNTSRSLNQLLVDAGYADLFKQGDYSRFSKKPLLSVSDVIQATSITVDEEGTVAAAATAVTMMRTSINFGVKKFKADQPFLFIIRNTKTNEIYFLGRVFNPHDES